MTPNSGKSEIIILQDSREKLGLFEVGKDAVQIMKLDTGDYSCLGYEESVSIERKGIGDAINSVLSDRKRFRREMERAKKLERFIIMIEGTEDDVRKHIKKNWLIRYRTKALRKRNLWRLISQQRSVINTYYHWEIEYGYPVHFCKNRKTLKKRVMEELRAFTKHNSEDKYKDIKGNWKEKILSETRQHETNPNVPPSKLTEELR